MFNGSHDLSSRGRSVYYGATLAPYVRRQYYISYCVIHPIAFHNKIENCDLLNLKHFMEEAVVNTRSFSCTHLVESAQMCTWLPMRTATMHVPIRARYSKRLHNLHLYNTFDENVDFCKIATFTRFPIRRNIIIITMSLFCVLLFLRHL